MCLIVNFISWYMCNNDLFVFRLLYVIALSCRSGCCRCFLTLLVVTTVGVGFLFGLELVCSLYFTSFCCVLIRWSVDLYFLLTLGGYGLAAALGVSVGFVYGWFA